MAASKINIPSLFPKDLNNDRPNVPILKDPNLASEFHKRLTTWINDFNRELDDEYEVGVQLVSFGEKVTFHIKNIGYWNPSLISFSGITDEGAPVELIQHVTQISILLMKMERTEPENPKKPIGFVSWEEFDKQKE